MIVIKRGAQSLPQIPKQAFKSYKKSISALVQHIIAKQGRPTCFIIHPFCRRGAAKNLHEQSIPYIVSEHLKEFIIADGLTGFQKMY
ncbi:MAG: hypothetical protein CM1200mP10_28160 [Candidatus Neomarinimicrobiota bacterium]|nr:MAG: hypothetical protein CM1200mP10_28160 [Candidatus Neomarinimicrobiota bacterium]